MAENETMRATAENLKGVLEAIDGLRRFPISLLPLMPRSLGMCRRLPCSTLSRRLSGSSQSSTTRRCASFTSGFKQLRELWVL